MAKLIVYPGFESSQMVCQSMKEKKVNIVAEIETVYIFFSFF